MTARALWSVDAGRCEIRTETLPPRMADQALVRALASGISRGTERLVLMGRVPDSQRDAMRCPFQAGDFPFPVKYGYSAVGVVEDGPDALLGRRVFVLHPHQDRFLAPVAMCIPVPDAVPDARAVLAANMETAVNILWDARPLAGERALVIGAGVVGLLVAALLARMPGWRWRCATSTRVAGRWSKRSARPSPRRRTRPASATWSSTPAPTRPGCATP